MKSSRTGNAGAQQPFASMEKTVRTRALRPWAARAAGRWRARRELARAPGRTGGGPHTACSCACRVPRDARVRVNTRAERGAALVHVRRRGPAARQRPAGRGGGEQAAGQNVRARRLHARERAPARACTRRARGRHGDGCASGPPSDAHRPARARTGGTTSASASSTSSSPRAARGAGASARRWRPSRRCAGPRAHLRRRPLVSHAAHAAGHGRPLTASSAAPVT